ncbi:hypothetical protein GCM10011390_19020 [Aureimonas endophytica]|uniref:Uncharacterized protein n=1 Tax=Aureimonas endophytica TaxID=2027858 RepID=A0A917E3L1_9HYPH|nr:hypothetical protein [Aureimonas endophytica]GGE00410.1 hypothetical protein GCM10011390_19020 [Aureimonas endophytica]
MAQFTTPVVARAWNAEKDAAAAETPIEVGLGYWSGIDVDGGLRVLELDAGAGRPLEFETHKRGNNWTAVLTGKNAANMSREFRRYQNRHFDYSSLSVGDALEVGADYVTSGGNRKPCRYYVLAVHIDDDRFGFVLFDTAAQVMKAARTYRQNVMIEHGEDPRVAAKAA